MEENEQPGGYYCGIKTSVRTAGTEILCVLEIRTCILIFICQAVVIDTALTMFPAELVERLH